uniref:Uncharacterized protein n=1 Tax=Rhizophora mucronata TaxID=61149 RepID=A0A2P2P9I0_RHIMU
MHRSGPLKLRKCIGKISNWTEPN